MDQIFRRAAVRARILGNPLGRILEEYVGYLAARGHRPGGLHQYVFAVEHFGRWLGREAISHESVDRFLSVHVPACRCEKPAACGAHGIRAALNRLLDMRGLWQPGPAVPPAVGRLLREYERHLRDACGLAEATTHYRVRYARDLLQRFEVHRASQLRHWLPTDLADYVARAGRQFKPSSGQVLASSVRAFLKFLLLQGLVPRDLAAAIPSFACWRLSALPVVVDRGDLEKMLNVVDATTPIGMRDRAILICLIDLGLRASDVASITTDGVDLTAGILRVDHPKERRATELPMSSRLSAALRQYLRRGRPPGGSRQLFVIHRAPIGRALKPIGIRGIVLRHAARAGLAESIRGTHVIRHSVASALINSGASIKDIADLLGHRSIDTTAIYAKVDMRSLAGVALPWPEARR